MPYADKAKRKLKQREYSKRFYEKHTELIKQRTRKSNKNLYTRNRRYVYRYKLTHVCVDCGENDPRCLEFDHHTERGEKQWNISDLVARKCSIDKLDEEIAKCEIRCANCHRRKTAKDFWTGHAKGE